MRKRKKLNDKGEICVFLGVSEACKAYKLYNPLTKKIVTSKDVIFDEEGTWDWSGQQLSLNILEADFEDGDQITTLAIIETLAKSTKEEAESREPRIRKRSAWMRDLEVTGINQIDDHVTHFALFADCDPATFENAIKEAK